MKIKRFKAENFRNIESERIAFSDGITIISGDNAVGKTSAVEGIYLCASGRSHRTAKDRDFIKFGEEGITVDPQTGLFSLLGLFAKVFVVDDIIDSINLCKSFTIITTKPVAINDFIRLFPFLLPTGFSLGTVSALSTGISLLADSQICFDILKLFSSGSRTDSHPAPAAHKRAMILYR